MANLEVSAVTPISAVLRDNIHSSLTGSHMAEPALSIRGLSKVYGNGFHALKGIDLDVAEGDFYALLGPNGAGKSTTLGVVCSLVQKTAGQVSIFGIDIDRDFARAKYHLGVVPQEFNFNQFEKVIDIVLAQAGYYGMSRREALPRAIIRRRFMPPESARAMPSRLSYSPNCFNSSWARFLAALRVMP